MRVCVMVLFTFIFQWLGAQNPEKLFNYAIEAFDNGDYVSSELLLQQSLDINRGSFIAWYYKGIVHLMQKEYYESVVCFNESALIEPDYNKTMVYRGLARQKTTDYEGALADYSRAIFLDSLSAEAYSFRGALYELFGDHSQACSDFTQASTLGDKWAMHKLDECRNDSHLDSLNVILKLEYNARTKFYGFSTEQPIKVGIGPDGGPANQRAYLELLRDPQGLPIEYKRVGSCCGYETKNGIDGYGLLDEYEIKYLDKKGRMKTQRIYMSFYDYEEPQILLGFQTVSPF